MGTVKQRFYERFTVNASGCWEWRGWKDKDGYGRFRMFGRPRRAHRVSWELHFGNISDGLLVCHSCDNPSCVNPRHLHLGTHAENVMEKVERNRQCMGERNANAKLAADDIHNIRRLLQSGARQIDIGAQYGISRQTVSGIKIGRLWGHIATT